MNAYVVTFLVSMAGATFVSPAFGDDRSPDEMRREVEAEFERLRAAGEKPAPPPAAPARPAPQVSADVVRSSPWDGSVHQVERYLKQSLKDPKSYDGIEWSPVARAGDGYVVRHKYRARNSFGGYVVENKIFIMNRDGDVVSVTAAK